MTTQQPDAPRVLCEVRRAAPVPPPVEAIVLTLPPDMAVTLRQLLNRVTGHPTTSYALHVNVIYCALANAMDKADGWANVVPARFTGGLTPATPLPPEPAR